MGIIMIFMSKETLFEWAFDKLPGNREQGLRNFYPTCPQCATALIPHAVRIKGPDSHLFPHLVIFI